MKLLCSPDVFLIFVSQNNIPEIKAYTYMYISIYLFIDPDGTLIADEEFENEEFFFFPNCTS